MISDQQILRYIQRQPRQTAGYKQLVRELGLRGHERRELEERLRAMKKRGEIVEIGRDKFALPKAGAEQNLISGRLMTHRDGYGFVAPVAAAGIEGDIFIPARSVGSAMHGDRVLVEVLPKKPDGRCEGRIVKITSRTHATVVGTFHYGQRHNFVTPIDDRISQEVIIPPGAEVVEAKAADPSVHRVIGREAARREWKDLEGLIVDVEITQWPTPTLSARGRIVEVLGYEDDFGVDVEIMIRKHHIPHVFPAEVLEQAQNIPAVTPHSEISARRDYRNLPIVTIDGETARDFDDAVLARRKDNGNFELQVHIADVAQYVTEDTPLDDETRMRGTSVYFPDRAVPMLPLELSTDLCSLRPQVDRLVLSCVMELDHAAEVVGFEICEGVIRSAARMTYTDVQRVIDGDTEARKQYSKLVLHLERAKELAELLNRKRVRRGSIDFDLPEPVIDFDEDGIMRGIHRSERLFAHRLIEEFMLAANECVASYLETRGVASLYRIHEKPSAKRVYEFETLAAGFGVSLGVGALPIQRIQMKGDRRHHHGSGRNPREVEIPQDVHITPRMYQKLVEKISGKPEERILSFLMLRSLAQAKYSEENVGHFALAAPSYTHFTSPIRRYPDLIVHRILKELIRDAEADGADAPVTLLGGAESSEAPSPWSKRHPQQGRHDSRKQSRHQKQIIGQHREELPGPIPEHQLRDIAEESSLAERRAQEAERELVEWKKIEFMRDRVGEEFDALIISTTKFGFFVELTDLFVEGLVPMQTLTDDRYTYRENTRQIIGERGRKTYNIGARVKVLLDRIDGVQKKLLFAVAEDGPPPTTRGSGRKRAKESKRRRDGGT